MRAYSIHNLAAAWAAGLNRRVQRDGLAVQKMTLGIEILLHNIPKLVLMAGLAAWLGILPQTLAAWAAFACVRKYACGLHAGDSFSCTAVTLSMFVAAPYALRDARLPVGIFALIMAITAAGLRRYAPADTAAHPLLGAKKRDRLKRQAVHASLVVTAVTLAARNAAFYPLAALGAVYALVLVLPISYKLLKRSRNNYEKYE